MIANANFKKKDGKPFAPADFLPGEPEPEKPIDLDTAMQTWT